MGFHQHAFLFILEVVSTSSCFLGTLAAPVLVVYQGDCSSGQLCLISFRLLVVLPPLEWKCMSDPVMDTAVR